MFKDPQSEMETPFEEAQKNATPYGAMALIAGLVALSLPVSFLVIKAYCSPLKNPPFPVDETAETYNYPTDTTYTELIGTPRKLVSAKEARSMAILGKPLNNIRVEEDLIIDIKKDRFKLDLTALKAKRVVISGVVTDKLILSHASIEHLSIRSTKISGSIMAKGLTAKSLYINCITTGWIFLEDAVINDLTITTSVIKTGIDLHGSSIELLGLRNSDLPPRIDFRFADSPKSIEVHSTQAEVVHFAAPNVPLKITPRTSTLISATGKGT